MSANAPTRHPVRLFKKTPQLDCDPTWRKALAENKALSRNDLDATASVKAWPASRPRARRASGA